MNFEHNQPSSTSNSSLTKSLKLDTLTMSQLLELEFDFALCHNYGWCFCCGYRG
jgi:hypothetical protein